VKAEQLFRWKGKGARMGGKKLTEERELKEQEEGEELGEGEKEYYQTVQIHLDSKGKGHVVSLPPCS
jgi:hypothetical protein